MGLKFFTDQCVSNYIIQSLNNAGHTIFRLRDYIPMDSPDPVVISKAQELDSILLSLDGDFADIVAYPPEDYKGIVALQVRNHPEIISQIMAILKDYLSANPGIEHYKGKLIIVEAHRIRIKE
ncbi:MAG: DUF5615 family PIN-like protein [Deltaproteobacteria bacterium]|nr:DUF5615 family PIN-like protein [Deltaproteobacteria bacterium]